jgi:predicted nuclease of predicted toxin-antitoxin system
MRVLLDESLPRQLRRVLAGHEVSTVPEAGWAGEKNGELLRLAEPQFDVFVTMDRRLPFQQNLSGLRLAIVILIARTNDIADLLPLASDLQAAVDDAEPGAVVRLSRDADEPSTPSL